MARERLIHWFLRVVNRTWVSVLLLWPVISILTTSLDKANWVKEDKPLVSAILVGLFFGWLLARSRFSGRFGFFYALFISIVTAIEAASGILQIKISAVPLADLVNQLNLRWFQFVLRTNGWIETLRLGQNVEDTGLFVLLLGWILTLCGAWMMWKITRHNQPLEGMLPAGFLLAVNVHLSRQPLTNYWIYLFLMILLTAQSAFRRQHIQWNQRRVDYPDQLGFGWGGVALSLAIVIALAARVAPVVGTPQGWQSIAEWVEKNRERTSDTAERLFSGVNPPPPAPEETPDLYVGTPNLGEIGRPIPQGFETILWVSTSDPPPVPPEVAINMPYTPDRIHYWRSGIFGVYTGRGWELASLLGDISSQENLPETAPAGRYYLRQSFTIVARHSGALFSVNDPLQTSQGVSLRQTTADGSRLVEGKVDEYEVISQAARVTANELSAAAVIYPDAVGKLYLQLPDTLPSRVRQLAERIVSGTDNPYIKALRIQNYLRENYPYDLTADLAPEKRDVVDYFLFDSQRGFCSHYATAMAVMLRSVGVPARVVTGYATGIYDYDRSAYRVPVSASHAWVEVFFPGFGWMEFEPTAFRSPFVYPEEIPLDTGLSQPLMLEKTQGTQLQPYILYLAGAGALFLLLLPFFIFRLITSSRSAPPVQAAVLYRRMRRALTWAGLAAGSNVTPDEYVLLVGKRLERYRQLDHALRQVTVLYRETMFSPRPPEESRVRAAGRLWQNALREWAALWLNERWQRLRSD